MKQQEILIIEDDDTIAFGIKIFLEKNNFIVYHAENIIKAKEIYNNKDLIILDLNLPDGNGYDFCKYIKSKTDIPIIFLTVRDDEEDIVKGLDIGADDYITKPFKLSILLSRINAVLRRTNKQEKKDILKCGNITLNKAKTTAYLKSKEINLTAGEYRLLLMFIENKNRTLARNILLEKLWDTDGNFISDNTLTVTIKRLREKLGNTTQIKTIRGIGYRLEN